MEEMDTAIIRRTNMDEYVGGRGNHEEFKYHEDSL